MRRRASGATGRASQLPPWPPPTHPHTHTPTTPPGQRSPEGDTALARRRMPSVCSAVIWKVAAWVTPETCGGRGAALRVSGRPPPAAAVLAGAGSGSRARAARACGVRLGRGADNRSLRVRPYAHTRARVCVRGGVCVRLSWAWGRRPCCVRRDKPSRRGCDPGSATWKTPWGWYHTDECSQGSSERCWTWALRSVRRLGFPAHAQVHASARVSTEIGRSYCCATVAGQWHRRLTHREARASVTTARRPQVSETTARLPKTSSSARCFGTSRPRRSSQASSTKLGVHPGRDPQHTLFHGITSVLSSLESAPCCAAVHPLPPVLTVGRQPRREPFARATPV